MSDETKTILDIDATKVALAVGHVAALALVTQLRDGSPDELQLYYRMFKPLEEGRTCEEDLAIMAQYICDRPGDVYGEQLYRKAAELALHDAPANGYDDQPFVVREAYRLFAKSCRLVAVDLAISKRQAQEKLAKTSQKRAPIKTEDQAFAPDEPANAQDPVRAAALKAMREMPKAKGPMVHEDASEDGFIPEFETPNPEQDGIFSIGERPVAHQGKPQRGGARNGK
nr:hypothetical protein [uncultured Cohaesibacter sp.]